LEKALKVREPLTKKRAEDPNCLATLTEEVEQLRAALATM